MSELEAMLDEFNAYYHMSDTVKTTVTKAFVMRHAHMMCIKCGWASLMEVNHETGHLRINKSTEKALFELFKVEPYDIRFLQHTEYGRKTSCEESVRNVLIKERTRKVDGLL